mmetsp:Transcript_14048/g.40053  ORF Transcript_14048/g.40053 Transcript_14048/m.40053 type:complete len:81 (-) Transcript_14048:302-544(-)
MLSHSLGSGSGKTYAASGGSMLDQCESENEKQHGVRHFVSTKRSFRWVLKCGKCSHFQVKGEEKKQNGEMNSRRRTPLLR